jgi:hypothetical protein
MKLLPIFESAPDVLYHGSMQKFDKFDISKIKSGDGLTKYGFGFYFSDDESTALKYTTGKMRFIYQVKLYNTNSYAQWDDPIEDNFKQFLIRKLNKAGKTDNAETVEAECGNEENGYDMWTTKEAYEILSGMLGSDKEASEWFAIGGINGIIAKNASLPGTIYVAFDEDDIKILDVEAD